MSSVELTETLTLVFDPKISRPDNVHHLRPRLEVRVEESMGHYTHHGNLVTTPGRGRPWRRRRLEDRGDLTRMLSTARV